MDPFLQAPPAIEAPPDLPAIEAGPVAPAPPAWRTVHKRPAKRDRNARGNTASPAPIAAIEPPKPEMPAWAQWRRECFLPCLSLSIVSSMQNIFAANPLLAPIASPAPQSPAPAERRGLFGECTSPISLRLRAKHVCSIGPPTPPPGK